MRTVVFLVALCGAFALPFAASAGAADSVYWTNGPANVIDRAPLSGGEGVSIAPTPVGADRPEGSAVDAATGKLYWANYFGETIGESNLDGSAAASLDVGAATHSGPIGVAIDAAAGKIFWASQNGEKISWAYLDGSSGGDLDTTGAPVDGPYDVVVDPAAGRVYWANYQGDSIGYANLDGSGGGGQLSIPGAYIEGPTGLAIDAANDTIYWTNYVGESIGWADLSGVGTGLLPISGGTGGPAGIAIDPEARRLYWGGERVDGIWSAPLAGGTAQRLDTGTVDASRAGFPFLFKAPAPAAGAAPVSLTLAPTGSTLSCGTPRWLPDLPESGLYRAPQTIAYGWTLNGAPIPGAAGQTLAASGPGRYGCQATATNGAGSTTVAAGSWEVSEAIHVKLVPVGRLTLTKVKFDRRHGTATLLVTVNGPGKVALSGRDVVGRTATSAGVGVVKLKVLATGKALRTLRQAGVPRDRMRKMGTAKVRVAVTFDPDEGAPVSASRRLTLREKQPGPRAPS